MPAQAGGLYLCKGDQGETVITNQPAQYKDCKLAEAGGAAPHTHHRSYVAPQVEATAVPIAAPELKAPEIIPASYAPPQSNATANPAVISIKPLQAAPAPVVRELPSTNVAVLQIGKPWPMTVIDALVVDLLPQLLDPHAGSLPAAAPPQPSLPARQASIIKPTAMVTLPASPTAAIVSKPLSTITPPRRGAVYKITRKNGVVEYTNIATRAIGADARTLFTYIITCYACNVHSHIDWNNVALHLDAYSDDIRVAAAQNGVDEALLRAVIHAESGFNPQALSYKGAQGLMQLMPGTASDMGVSNAFDVAQNIRGGAKYLAMLLKDFSGNVKLAAAAYNAGEAAVRKYNGVPPFDETQVYVKRVALLRDRYLKALHPTTLASAGLQ